MLTTRSAPIVFALTSRLAAGAITLGNWNSSTAQDTSLMGTATTGTSNTTTNDVCTTPTVTLLASYTKGTNGLLEPSTETLKPKDLSVSCQAVVVTTSITFYEFTGTIDSDPARTEFSTVEPAVQSYLDDLFKSIYPDDD
ncbi:hypothetical protein F4821DRAFT_258954 [Hypoxylon rubiginosum]|uniref:Uncharacterized protein n=1 Tax=Hypoxylon rubiginosum TaxID=110542 RepID=A0ACC0D4V0_9PEZI|nr:hypothetical protein F4821DRAFT_258954 [Hypoxylon rubiginosum]